MFDEELDSFYDVKVQWCESPIQLYWMAIFVAAHGVMLGLSCFQAFSHKRKYKFVRERFKSEVLRLRWASMNATIVVIFTILLMIVVPTKPATIAYLQLTVFASCELVYSATTSSIIFFPFYVRLFARNTFDINVNRRNLSLF